MTTTYAATAKQLEFLATLVRDRMVPEGYTVPTGLNSKEASAEIGKLLGMERRPSEVIDLTGVLALFTAAKAHLKFPKIRLHDTEATPMVLSVATDRARYPGSVNLLGEKGWDGVRPFHGRIHTDGTLERRGLNDAAVALLKRFAADPAGVAMEYGRLTGNCCFCGAALTDERSTDMGYGPVCAKNYGLEWGKGAKAPAPDTRSVNASTLGWEHGQWPSVFNYEGFDYVNNGWPEEGDGEFALYVSNTHDVLRVWSD